jgi:hypothetical protein
VKLRFAIVGVGLATALAPLAWGPFFGSRIDTDLGSGLLLAWQFLPFAVLIVAREKASLSAPAALAALTALTAALDVSVLLYSLDAQSPVALVFAPAEFAIGVGLLIGVDSVARLRYERARPKRL